MKWLQIVSLIILITGIWIGIKIPRPYTQQFSFKKANFSGKSSRRRIRLSRLGDAFILIGTTGQLISIFLI